MRVAIVGLGSIGKRHYDLLCSRGAEVAVSSTVLNHSGIKNLTLQELVTNFSPSVIWVCNETNKHHETLEQILSLGYKGKVLIEKPVFHEKKDITSLPQDRVYVSYNLRFHPGIQMLKSELIKNKEKIIALNCYVGQYLPLWRPDRDYRKSYSASAEQGGGCLRDLSHELDYVTWICGFPDELTATGGKISGLEINSDDYFSILLKGKNFPVSSVTLNYLDRSVQRFLMVQTNLGSYYLNFIDGTLKRDADTIMDSVKIAETYSRQVNSILENNFDSFATLKDSNRLLGLLEKCEESNKETKWVRL